MATADHASKQFAKVIKRKRPEVWVAPDLKPLMTPEEAQAEIDRVWNERG